VTDKTAPITLTERAARRVKAISAQEGVTGGMLRVSVSGGGCSGFQYGFSLDDEVKDDDVVVTRDGATVVIDSISLMYLAGSEIDYIDELVGAYFTLNNPNAVASCGCGTSFAVAM